jgi:hypothetical protein
VGGGGGRSHCQNMRRVVAKMGDLRGEKTARDEAYPLTCTQLFKVRVYSIKFKQHFS